MLAQSVCPVPGCPWRIENVTPDEAVQAWLDHAEDVHERGGGSPNPVGSGLVLPPPPHPSARRRN